LPEAEIHARLVEALGAVTEDLLAPLRAAAASGRTNYAQEIAARVLGDPHQAGQAPVLLYRTLDLPAPHREGAVVFGLVLKLALESPESLARAGFGGTPFEAAVALFDAIVASPSGLVFAVDEWADVTKRIGTPDGKIHVALPDLLDELEHCLARHPSAALSAEFPFVLTAGERRSFTANTIIRDSDWRKKDARGALRIHPDDASRLGVPQGGTVRLTTRRGSVIVPVELSTSMQCGHVALPNGMGLDARGDGSIGGVAPNELTSQDDRDPFVGTPWHKHVPARIEAVR